MDKHLKIILATSAGLLTGAMGVVVTGYLAAIAVPEGYFAWFQEHLSIRIGLGLLDTVQHIICFGILLLAAGYLVTRRLHLPPLIAALCLLTGLWVYCTIGVALFYDALATNPIHSMNIPVAIMPVIHIIFVAIGIFWASKHNHAMHATSA